MTGQAAEADSRWHRFRRVRSQVLWLVLAAAVAYALLVALMVLSAKGSVSTARALAGTPMATEEAMPVEPVALRPAPAATHPRETAEPQPATGVVYYSPADSAAGSTAAPVPGPATTTVAPVTAAQQAVDRARQALSALQADSKATAAELAVARYELARALQSLADVAAGTPGKAHHDLDVRQARVYRNLAIERCRQAMTDPAATRATQDQAYSLVQQWQNRLDDLLA
jgi:hypothetical protein